MEWFGLTIYGVPDPIKDMMRPDYVEPIVQPNINEIIAKGSTKTFSELIADLDIYIGTADGYAYKSYGRLLLMRNKGMFKPVGPSDMYRYPGTNMMIPTFWMSDPALVGEDWYKPSSFSPKPVTDVSKFFDEALKKDKFFKL